MSNSPFIIVISLVCIILVGAIALMAYDFKTCIQGKTELVTTVDGCKVYKIKMCGSHPLYVTTCKGSTQQTVPNGKSNRIQKIETK